MSFEMTANKWSKWRAPRRDPGALGFGIAFVALGVTGLLRSAGARVDAELLSQLGLIALGIAGLVTVLTHRSKPPPAMKER